MEVVSTSTSRLNDSPSYCLIGNRASPGVITQNYFEVIPYQTQKEHFLYS